MANLENKVNPLDWRVAVVNKDGTPTNEFQRKWAQQAKSNGSIPDLSTVAKVSAVLDMLAATPKSILLRGTAQWAGFLPTAYGLLIADNAGVITSLVPPGDATKFLNGATPAAFAKVKDSDLAVSDVATNNVSIAQHGFAPKLPNDVSKFLDGTGAYSTPGPYLSAALTSTHILVGNAGNVATSVAASGDIVLSNTGVFTVLGAGGVAFGSAAFTAASAYDAAGAAATAQANAEAFSANAANITSGIIPNARISALPNANLANSSVTISGHALALGGALALASGDISGLAASATTDTTSAANISSGLLPNARLSAIPNSALANSGITIDGVSIALGAAVGNKTANFAYMGPASGGAAAPTFRALVAADIPAGFAVSGVAFHPGFTAGRYYWSTNYAALSLSTVTGTLYFTPFYVPTATTFTKISIRTGTVSGTPHAALGIYTNANGQPAALFQDCGRVALSGSVINELTGLTIDLTPGWYWLAVSVDATATLFGCGATSLSGILQGSSSGSSNPSGYSQAWTYNSGANTLPAVGSLSDLTGTVPSPFLRL